MAYLTIKGMQSSGLITCTKHFIAYEQQPVCSGPLTEDGGPSDCDDVSSDVDGGVTGEFLSYTLTGPLRQNIA